MYLLKVELKLIVVKKCYLFKILNILTQCYV